MKRNYQGYIRKTIFPDLDGKKFHNHWTNMRYLCECIVERLKNDLDCTILITGKTGIGKSTAAGKACFKFFEKIENLKNPGEMMWNDDNYIIDPEVYAARIAKDKGNVLWLDEAIDAVSRRNWHSKINNLIINRKNKNRKSGIVSFIILPYEKEVDKNFTKHITIWIWVYARGKAQVFISGNHKKGGESLSVDKIIEREEKWWKENPKAKVCWGKIHPEFIGHLYWDKFTVEEQKRYDKLVEKYSSVGKLTDEEEVILNPKDEIDKEALIPEMLDKAQAGEIKSKRELWETLKEQTGFKDSLLIRYLNRHLKIRGLKTFNSFSI